jgi:hypothetical protein
MAYVASFSSLGAFRINAKVVLLDHTTTVSYPSHRSSRSRTKYPYKTLKAINMCRTYIPGPISNATNAVMWNTIWEVVDPKTPVA